ncbi:origin recognition complex subunit 3-like [Procambarus clarkii]|uniref:origin recognition complex subunit 3-like n=1 Tax=Procambarus clarkii TaxID=6728 RepID=UPI003742D3F2
MPPAQLDVIHKLPSFRSYVESRPPKEQTALLLDEKTSKATVRTLMNELDSWHGRFCCLVKVVHALTSSLPSTPLGRQQDAKAYMAREELLPILTNILDIL